MLGGNLDPHSLPRRITSGYILTATPMLVIGFAGVMKLADLWLFQNALTTWTLVPAALLRPLTLLIPTTEVTIAGLWLLGINRAFVEGAALSLLVIFGGVLSAHFLLAQPPDCGCFGRLLRFQSLRDSAVVGIGKSFGLALILAVGVWATRAARRNNSRMSFTQEPRL